MIDSAISSGNRFSCSYNSRREKLQKRYFYKN